MATKKKAAKPAKKTTPAKKAVPAKKAASKPAHSSVSSKSVKKAPALHAKGNAKPVVKKPVPHKKSTLPMPSKKPSNSRPVPTASKSVPAASKSVPAASKSFHSAAKSIPPASKSVPAGAKQVPTPVKPLATVSKPGLSPVKGAALAALKPLPKQTQTPPPVVSKYAPAMATAKPIIAVKMPETLTSAASGKSDLKKIPAKPTKVIIPEMKSKSVRKYEPEFTKSVLDTPHEEQTGPTMRYSDGELGEFRDLINRKLDAAKKELAYLQGLITRKDEMGGDNDDARYMTMEDGSMSMEREQLSQMASRQITFIDHLEKAIMRIENKTYGICRVTGKLIDKARLRAVPHATLSIEAKQMMNK
jgi:RNA polymerase-binding transcription factor DksA